MNLFEIHETRQFLELLPGASMLISNGKIHLIGPYIEIIKKDDLFAMYFHSHLIFSHTNFWTFKNTIERHRRFLEAKTLLNQQQQSPRHIW